MMKAFGLPPPQNSSSLPKIHSTTASSNSREMISLKKTIPVYGKRKGWIPRVLEDFGDGGAFPEIHVSQFPLEMGRPSSSAQQKTVPVTLDGQGRIRYEKILQPGSDKQIQARHEDLAAKKFEEDDLAKPDSQTEAKVAQETKEALEKVIQSRIAASQPVTAGKKGVSSEPTYVEYTPLQSGTNRGSNVEKRIIQITETAKDPLEPSKFLLNKKVPKGPPSPPVPVMHSPPRKVTAKDQQDWKIPPCISNWKNNKGYTISLDKRLVADGRGLQDYTPNDRFSVFAEALYMAEATAREEVQKRAELDQRRRIIEKEKKEEEYRKLAQEARMERTATSLNEEEEDEDYEGREERDKIREERDRIRNRDYRMQKNRSAASRNAERDVGERIALGQSVPNASSEAMYDQRLFNQQQGMDSGFGGEDSYNIYTKQLFQGSSANVIYRPKQKEDEYGSHEDMKKLTDTSKFKADKQFSGSDNNRTESRNAPVEFEKDDPFQIDAFLNEAKTKASRSERSSASGFMHASAGNADTKSMNESGGSKRNRIQFDSKSDQKDNNKYSRR
eukprot:TRINITY_DN4846_c0_g1_i1.p1 TRINITY_DN4846_c0_g1~~TRINITY_DN4846_c0_g1_i1.p1  ORF type:complete len:559 (+),score=166.29 TRINITY_DN4846_c0_g1_i1:108-1784(+)